jgi:hypothetical protein
MDAKILDKSFANTLLTYIYNYDKKVSNIFMIIYLIIYGYLCTNIHLYMYLCECVGFTFDIYIIKQIVMYVYKQLHTYVYKYYICIYKYIYTHIHLYTSANASVSLLINISKLLTFSASKDALSA